MKNCDANGLSVSVSLNKTDQSFYELGKAFWQNVSLDNLTPEQWEALCDGCGKCCLHKVKDEDEEVYYSDLACHLLDVTSCECKYYATRFTMVDDCAAITPENIDNIDWLPDTCAYRLKLAELPLYDWHYLMSGSRESVHKANESVRDFAIPCHHDQVDDIIVEHILQFKP